jgi:Phytochelatin synthase
VKKRIWVTSLVVGLIAAAGLGVLSLYPRPPAVPREVVERAVVTAPSRLAPVQAMPVARSLLGELSYQENGTSCGPASLANVFRSFGQAERSESSVLDGTGRCPFGICSGGLTLDDLAEVAKAHTQRPVTVLRDLSPEAFLEEMKKVNDPVRRYIINFHRKPIFGTGGGHHSPIGAYLEKEDLVLVVDVNENYGPWLIERARLYAAMNTLDGDKKRGLLRLE